MARLTPNPAIRSISGLVDGFVYRHQPDGTITIARSPLRNPNRPISPARLAQTTRFKQAMLRSSQLLQDLPTRAAYEWLHAGRSPMLRLNAMVVSDILKPPLIPTLDLSAYHGHPGDTIRIVAQDNLAIARLDLLIRDLATGRDVETAANTPAIAQLSPRLEWRYTTTTAIPAGHPLEIRVTAYDLAGNQTETRPVET